MHCYQRLEAKTRQEFLEGLKPGGKYEGIVGIYSHNNSADHIGIFDKDIIHALSSSLNWIAHNGAGYDQIDVLACREKGILMHF